MSEDDEFDIDIGDPGLITIHEDDESFEYDNHGEAEAEIDEQQNVHHHKSSLSTLPPSNQEEQYTSQQLSTKNCVARTTPEQDVLKEDCDGDEDDDDDEYDKIMSQIDTENWSKPENKLNRASPEVVFKVPAVPKIQEEGPKQRLTCSVGPSSQLKKDSSGQSSKVSKSKCKTCESEMQDSLICKKCESTRRSPMKRELSSEMSAFFHGDGESVEKKKQKFPGPAGLLPDFIGKNGQGYLGWGSLVDGKKSPEIQKYFEECRSVLRDMGGEFGSFDSGADGGVKRVLRRAKGNVNLLVKKERKYEPVSNAAWRSMMGVLGLNLRDEGSLLNVMNIGWVKENAEEFPETVKIPLLVMVVKSGGGGGSEVWRKNCLRLMDQSGGVITAAVDNQFMEVFGGRIGVGAVVAVRNCRILRSRKSVILVVTKKNLVCLTSMKKGDGDEEVSYRDDIHGAWVVKRSELMPDEVRKDYYGILEAMRRRNGNGKIEVVEEKRQQSGLFNVVGSDSGWSAGFDDDDDDAEFLEALKGIDLEALEGSTDFGE